MAGIRRRGHDPVLCAAAARIGVRQVESAKDHRRRHGLALPERAQTRAEGIGPGKGRTALTMVQTRRRFLTTASMAGAVGLVDAPAVLAEEGPLETTAVRLEKSAALCIAPHYLV